jgi:hypothetical protein
VKKEILGHLIDSAANNIQRFVRAAAADPLVFPGYDQNAWVAMNAVAACTLLSDAALTAQRDTAVPSQELTQDVERVESRHWSMWPETFARSSSPPSPGCSH